MSAERPLVLVVEDDPQMGRFFVAALEANDYRVLMARTVREALQLAPSHLPAVVILDLGLPDGDGLEVTRRLREWSSVPVIVVSARGREEDKVLALDAGADDYLTKPFGTLEPLARLRVALRHRAQTEGGAIGPIVVGPLVVDIAAHVVTLDGHEVHLQPTAFKVLALLATHAGKVLTHRFILREVWGPNTVTQSHYVRVQMAELRKRLEKEPARPRLLHTEPGVGYRLKDEQAPS